MRCDLNCLTTATLKSAGTNQSQSALMPLPTDNLKAPALGTVIGAEKLLEVLDAVPFDFPQAPCAGSIHRCYGYRNETVVLNAPSLLPLYGLDYAERSRRHQTSNEAGCNVEYGDIERIAVLASSSGDEAKITGKMQTVRQHATQLEQPACGVEFVLVLAPRRRIDDYFDQATRYPGILLENRRKRIAHRQAVLKGLVISARPLGQARALCALATFAPCLPNAVRVAAERWLIVFLRFAAAAALWTLRRAADFCFAVGISSLRGIAHSAYCTIGTLRLSVLGARNCRQKMT